MKLKYLLVLLTSLLLSCSNNDENTSTPGKDLASTIDKHYFNGNVTSRIETYYSNNKATEMLFYTGSTLTQKYVHEYGSDGQVAMLKIYNLNNDLAVTNAYQYNNAGRLIGAVRTDLIEGDEIQWGPQTTYTYTYNEDTIVVNQASSGSPSDSFTYYVNTEGRIYKAVGENGSVLGEVAYEGNNILWYKYGSTLMTYTYDHEHEAKGHYLNFFKNQMNGHELNHVVSGGFANALIGTDHYMIHQSGANGEVGATYQFEFDSEGFPVKKSIFSLSSTQPNNVVEINYQ